MQFQRHAQILARWANFMFSQLLHFFESISSLCGILMFSLGRYITKSFIITNIYLKQLTAVNSHFSKCCTTFLATCELLYLHKPSVAFWSLRIFIQNNKIKNTYMQCMYEVVCLLAKQLLNLSALILLCRSAVQKSWHKLKNLWSWVCWLPTIKKLATTLSLVFWLLFSALQMQSYYCWGKIIIVLEQTYCIIWIIYSCVIPVQNFN
jgi:hypothetical protein